MSHSPRQILVERILTSILITAAIVITSDPAIADFLLSNKGGANYNYQQQTDSVQ